MPEKRIMERLVLGKYKVKHVRQKWLSDPLYLQVRVTSESDVSVLVIQQSQYLASVDSRVDKYHRVPLVSGKNTILPFD